MVRGRWNVEKMGSKHRMIEVGGWQNEIQN